MGTRLLMRRTTIVSETSSPLVRSVEVADTLSGTLREALGFVTPHHGTLGFVQTVILKPVLSETSREIATPLGAR